MKYLPIVAVVINIIVSVILGFCAFPKTTMEKLYIQWIFYFLLGNVLLGIFAFIRAESDYIEKIKKFFRKNTAAIVIAGILVVCGCLVSKPDFKILADETNLLSMSQSLYEDRECKNYTSVLYYYHSFKNVLTYINDKRPALFPFTVSIFHSILGYRPENVFVVNAISGFLCLILLYQLIGYRFGRFWGICGILMLAAYPLFILYMTSGGFEVFNLLFTLLVFKYLVKFIKSPSAVYAEMLLLLLPLLGQTRYESVLAVFCIIPAILICLPRGEYGKFTYKLPLVPLLFVPIVWLRLATDSAKAWQVADLNDSFTIQWFFKNLQQAVVFFFSGARNYGVIPLISALSVVGIVFLTFYVFAKKNKKSMVIFFTIFIFYLLHGIARFSYSMCDFTSVAANRLAIVFLPLIIYGAIICLYKCHKWFKIRKAYFAGTLILLLVFYWPSCGLTMSIRELVLYREFKTAREFLEANFPNKKDYIVVADRANLYTPLKYSSISFKYLRDNNEKVLGNFRNRTYSYMIILQMVDKSSGIAIDSCMVPSKFKLEKLYESQIRSDRYLRISRWRLN